MSSAERARRAGRHPVYYMRFAGAPHDALIVTGKPQPIYFTFANRNK